MAVLTAIQVADAWIAAGGPENRAVEFTAIAMGESSFDTLAVSPAGAQGLWQIMPFWWPQLGINPSLWSDPVTNAKAAVAISGHGSNCAAWDSCYRDIYVSGRYNSLAWPEVGSADYNNLAPVSAAIGRDKLGGAVPPTGSPVAPGVAKAAAGINMVATRIYPGLDRIVIANRMALNALWK